MAPPLKPLRELSYVPLADVAADDTFRLRHAGDVSSLARSIAQVGQLFPVDVRETEGGKVQILAGFRRLEALRMLQRNRVLVRNHGPLSDDAAATVAAADAIDNRSLGLEDLRELRDRYQAMGWGTPALLELVGRSIEKEGERLEDLAAKVRGEAPPDRSIPDEDGDDEASATAAELGDSVDPTPDEAARSAGASSAPDEPTDRGVAPPAGVELDPLPLDPPLAARFGPVEDALDDVEGEVTPDALARQIAARLSEATQDLAILAEHWSLVPAGLRSILADQLDYYGQLAGWLDPKDGDDT